MTDTFRETLQVTCDAFPLQIEGPVDGGFIYFRARHGGWSLGIGRTQNEAVMATLDCREPVAFRGSDEGERMSLGDQEAAWELLEQYIPRLRLEKQ